MMKKTILIALLLCLAGFIQAQPAIPTKATAVESFDMPGYFMVCTTSQGAVQMVVDGDQTEQGEWNVVPGNTGAAGTVSFSPVALPDHFMRHRSYVFYCDPAATDNLYLQDSTFTPVEGLADPAYISFRSVNYPTMYLQHNSATPMGLILAVVNTGDEGAATFKFPGLHKLFASDPNPEDEELDVAINASLSWKPGDYADTHNVFIGTDANDANNATIDDPIGVTVAQGLALDVNYFDPGTLEYGTTYYWRVDEVNAPDKPGTYKGEIWSFTVEPLFPKVPASNIEAIAKNKL